MIPGLAIVLGGGGARAAYQSGVLRRIGRAYPDLRPAILVGESAGAINAAHLAAQPGSFSEATEGLVALWSGLTTSHIFRVESQWLARNALRWALRLVSGGSRLAPEVRSLLDTAPLRSLLETAVGAVNAEIPGIARRIEEARLESIALTTLDYSTGESVTWVQGARTPGWERPSRRSVAARIGVDHVMASSALPLVFPAVALEGSWHGDGGMRLHAPLSPAVHLGATRILAISTRPPAARAAASRLASAYPPPAQIAGVLLRSAFLDLMEQDALNLERLNRLLRRLPAGEEEGLRPIELLVIRPSEDLGSLARACESCLPRGFRFMTRGLGTREAASSELLSLLTFEPEYLRRLVEAGEADAEERLGEIAALVEDRKRGVA